MLIPNTNQPGGLGPLMDPKFSDPTARAPYNPATGPQENAADTLLEMSNAPNAKPGPNKWVEAAYMGLGPLSGLMGMLGAQWAGKDKDMAYARGNAMGQQIQQARAQMEQQAEMKRQARIREQIQGFSVAAAAGASKKDLQPMASQILVGLGIKPTFGEVENMANNPAVAKVLSGNPDDESMAAVLKLGDENPTWWKETASGQMVKKVVEGTMEKRGDLGTEGIDFWTQENARKNLMGHLSFLPDEEAKNLVDMMVPEGIEKVSAAEMGRIRQMLPRMDQPLGELAFFLGEKAGWAPEESMLFARMSATQGIAAYRAVVSMDQKYNTPFALLQHAADQVLNKGEPLDLATETLVKSLYSQDFVKTVQAIGGINMSIMEEQILNPDPENPTVKAMEEGKLRAQEGPAAKLDLLTRSQELRTEKGGREMENIIPGMIDQTVTMYEMLEAADVLHE